VRLFHARLFQHRPWNLPDARTWAGDRAGRMRRFVEHHSLAEDRSRKKGGQDDGPRLRTAHDIDFALKHEPEPLPRGAFVKEAFARREVGGVALLDDGGEVFGGDADAFGRGGDGIEGQAHDDWHYLGKKDPISSPKPTAPMVQITPGSMKE